MPISPQFRAGNRAGLVPNLGLLLSVHRDTDSRERGERRGMGVAASLPLYLAAAIGGRFISLGWTEKDPRSGLLGVAVLGLAFFVAKLVP